jgi:hypothetical protein
MTEPQFTLELKRVRRNLVRQIRRKGWNAKVAGVSKIATTQCEWCQRNTLHASFVFEKRNPSGPDFSEGFCNFGAMEVFADKKFRLQSEWWVCGRCKNS